MVVALEDLSVLLLWVGAFILASLAYVIAKSIASIIDVDLPLFGHVFHGVAVRVENGIVNPLNDLRHASDARVTKGFNALLDALELGLGVTLLLGDAVYLALHYLWNTALAAFVNHVLAPVRKVANQAAADVATLTTTVAHNLTKAETYARARAGDALTSAKGYTDTHLAAVAKVLRGDIAAVTNRIDAAAGAAAAELPGLPSLGWDELSRRLGLKDLSRLAGLLASIPLLAQLVRTLARESGLERAECRGKVKNICETDPALWEGLLAGLFALGFAFSLEELADTARPVIDELEPIVRRAA